MNCFLFNLLKIFFFFDYIKLKKKKNLFLLIEQINL
jgi:hypothetical protein